MKYRIQIQQVFGGNWKSIEEASQHAEWLEKDNIKPRSRAAALEALEAQMALYKNGAPHRVVSYFPDGTFEVLYTLSRGTPFFPAEAQQHPTLADIAAKFEDAPLYECEIPGAPGRVTYGQSAVGVSRGVAVELEAISEPATGRATRDLPPGVYIAKALDAYQVGTMAALEFAVGPADADPTTLDFRKVGYVGRCFMMPLSNPGNRAKRHRPRTYNELNLGIDKFQVIRTAHFSSMLQCDRASDQDDYVCRIEQELVQYIGRRKTPTLNRKVDRLRKILRTLKRGLYE